MLRYETLTKNHEYFAQAVDCLATTFAGTNVAGKWVQEPMVGCLDIDFQELHDYIENYLYSVADQGYCFIAVDNNTVVGAIVGDLNILEANADKDKSDDISGMDLIGYVLSDVSERFMGDYEKQYGEKLHYGESLNLYMIGLRAEHNRREIYKKLLNTSMDQAISQGIKLAYGFCTTPKSLHLSERYADMHKYKDINGNYITYMYRDNKYLNSIPSDIAEGTYVIVRLFEGENQNRGLHPMCVQLSRKEKENLLK